jgi:CheY-like chemotaxis protein
MAKLREDPTLNLGAVMMLTSGDHPQDSQRCKDLGIDDYAIKPVPRKSYCVWFLARWAMRIRMPLTSRGN